MPVPRNICFVTGTRAEFGLMQRTLSAINASPSLKLQIVATGMHLNRSRGDGLRQIRRAGYDLSATVPWSSKQGVSATETAIATGKAMASLAATFQSLATDIVLVVGDRVEAFAAAAAAHVAGRCVAHVHGGDRAIGVIDDSLRHAITKLSHLHFPATATSAKRLRKMGEDPWRIHRVGSPGLDGIIDDAATASLLTAALKSAHADTCPAPRSFALVVLHPTGEQASLEQRRASELLTAVRRTPFERVVVVYPNNDPGSDGIVRCWEAVEREGRSARGLAPVTFFRNLPRSLFLGFLRDCAVLVGNSSSGIIEAASFRTPVVDIGPRQAGREHGKNVVHVGYVRQDVFRVLRDIWNGGRPRRFAGKNLYGSGRAAEQIVQVLATANIDRRFLQKQIAY